MNFVSIRLITNNVDGLVQFYEQITGLSIMRFTEDFADRIVFVTGCSIDDAPKNPKFPPLLPFSQYSLKVYLY